MGNTSKCSCKIATRWDHPYIRGEHPGCTQTFQRLLGSSLHTWGTLIPHNPLTLHYRDHPYIRGEHSEVDSVADLSQGSSLHTWGTRDISMLSTASLRIIPTYVGNTTSFTNDSNVYMDHPYIRGEHPPAFVYIYILTGSSLHTWGTLQVCST